MAPRNNSNNSRKNHESTAEKRDGITKKKLPRSRLPVFEQMDTVRWFHKLEKVFSASNIHEDKEKIKHAMSGLPPAFRKKHHTRTYLPIAEIANSYFYYKKNVIDLCIEIEVAKAKKEIHNEGIGDRKPSEFLAYLIWFFDNRLSYHVLRKVWIDQLSRLARNILSISWFAVVDLDHLAILADGLNPRDKVLNLPADRFSYPVYKELDYTTPPWEREPTIKRIYRSCNGCGRQSVETQEVD